MVYKGSDSDIVGRFTSSGWRVVFRFRVVFEVKVKFYSYVILLFCIINYLMN